MNKRKNGAVVTRKAPPVTAGDHRANLLAKQLAGHQRLIGELQQALKVARDREFHAQVRADSAQMTLETYIGFARALHEEGKPFMHGDAAFIWWTRMQKLLGTEEKAE